MAVQHPWQSYPSGFSSNVDALERTHVDPWESIGQPSDAKATAVNSTNSMFAYLKGIAAELGVPDGSGAGVVNTRAKGYSSDLDLTIGDKSDAPATSTGAFSGLAFLKGIARAVGV